VLLTILRNALKQTKGRINEFSKVAGCKSNIRKSAVF
jgi:hypothetical protein